MTLSVSPEIVRRRDGKGGWFKCGPLCHRVSPFLWKDVRVSVNPRFDPGLTTES